MTTKTTAELIAVPTEPTGAQIVFGIHCLEKNDDLPNIGYGPKAVAIYKAMISASPAKDRLETLQAENQRLREALERIIAKEYFGNDTDLVLVNKLLISIRDVAKEALQPKEADNA